MPGCVCPGTMIIVNQSLLFCAASSRAARVHHRQASGLQRRAWYQGLSLIGLTPEDQPVVCEGAGED
jgi:hypothetical protein